MCGAKVAVTLIVLRKLLGVAAPPVLVPDVIATRTLADDPSRW
jgi:hypothetical protein